MTIQTGLARVAADGMSVLDGKRIGLLVNATSVDAELRHAIDLLRARPDFNVTALFGPDSFVEPFGSTKSALSVFCSDVDLRVYNWKRCELMAVPWRIHRFVARVLRFAWCFFCLLAS